jgi:aryl-alcohol dehydrogenase-like predicted oxidoreductase
MLTMLGSRRDFFRHTAVASSLALTAAETDGEWRNKQSGMAYRRLGRTNMMISEVICGGDPITLDNYKHLHLAIEMGLNYLDMAPAYNRGDTERAYGVLLKETTGLRDKVFLTTKISGFREVRDRMYKEIYNGLPADKQSAIQKSAADMMFERGVQKPGYYLDYYPGQRMQLPAAYIPLAMMRDYAHQVDGGQQFRDFMTRSVEGSLERVGTDHFDIVMCPHGACAPEDLDNPYIFETFQKLKKEGKVRFLGCTSHNDPAGVLRKATEVGHYDLVMCAYNVINGGYVEEALSQAYAKGLGVIAMKAAHAVATHHKPLQPVPQWRIDKINRIVAGDMKAPIKAYLWALQNPHLTAVISNLWDETYVRENLAVAGKKIELQWA